MSKIRRLFKGGENGFTLIELLVVIAVLGILAAIAIPRLGGVTDQARSAEATSAIGSIKTAMEMADTQYGSYPTVTNGDADDVLATNIGQYIDSLPTGWTYTIATSSSATLANSNSTSTGAYRILVVGTGDNSNIAAEYVRDNGEDVIVNTNQ